MDPMPLIDVDPKVNGAEVAIQTVLEFGHPQTSAIVNLFGAQVDIRSLPQR